MDVSGGIAVHKEDADEEDNEDDDGDKGGGEKGLGGLKTQKFSASFSSSQ